MTVVCSVNSKYVHLGDVLAKSDDWIDLDPLESYTEVTVSLPIRTLDEQSRILTYLDGLQAKVNRLKPLQKKTATELDALLPSILDKAFKGEL